MERGHIIGALAAIAAASWLSACSSGPDDGAAGNGTEDVAGATIQPAGGAAAVAADARIYAIDPAQSEVYWRIYRAGALARLGHNHIISAETFSGSIALGDDPAAATWELSFPVAELVIDDPDLRARYGEDFESVPSEEDKSGTRDNMLTDRVLDGASFPQVRLEGAGFTGSLDAASLPVRIELLGRTVEQVFPASISIAGDTVTVTGERQLTHADLGMEPFSLFGGAMAVGDEIDFTYQLHAVAVDQ